MERIRVEKQIGAGTFSIETGALAKQAAGCVTVQYGDTVVLCAAATGTPRPGIDFFPLTCDYRERQAAAGKFPGGFLKREGRPTMKETLTARLVDRPIRPMFPKGFNDEVQIQTFVVSSDRQTDGDVLAMNGACAALGVSPLPFQGPLASVRIGCVDGQFIPFPTQDDLETSTLDLIVSGNKDAVLMIEGFARELPEDTMVDAILKAHEVIRELCDLQQELIDKVGVEKMEFVAPESDGLYDVLAEKYTDALRDARQTEGKHARAEAVSSLKQQALETLIPDPDAEGAYTTESFGKSWHDLEEHVIRQLILEGKRSDGRSSTELRKDRKSVV